MEIVSQPPRSFDERAIEGFGRNHEFSSGVSWGAVAGGAFVAAAVALILLALGAGFGLTAVSPWSSSGASAAAVANASIAWLIVIQVVSCALGGYLAGRLRTKWVAIHTDEVYFRDTANGFLVWAVGLVLSVTFLVSTASSMAGDPTPRDGTAARVATDPNSYLLDALFRSDPPAASSDDRPQAEAGRILRYALRQKEARPADQAYLAKLVAAKTGITQADAENRVAQLLTEARQTEDNARQIAARLLFWIFIALILGAFSASYAATIGGRQRDHVKLI